MGNKRVKALLKIFNKGMLLTNLFYLDPIANCNMFNEWLKDLENELKEEQINLEKEYTYEDFKKDWSKFVEGGELKDFYYDLLWELDNKKEI